MIINTLQFHSFTLMMLNKIFFKNKKKDSYTYPASFKIWLA